MPEVTILQVGPRLDAGGSEQATVEIAQALTSVGASALVATEGGRLATAIADAGSEIVPLPVASKNPLTNLANARRLAKLIEDRGVDLVHARSRAPAWSAISPRTGARSILRRKLAPRSASARGRASPRNTPCVRCSERRSPSMTSCSAPRLPPVSGRTPTRRRKRLVNPPSPGLTCQAQFRCYRRVEAGQSNRGAKNRHFMKRPPAAVR